MIGKWIDTGRGGRRLTYYFNPLLFMEALNKMGYDKESEMDNPTSQLAGMAQYKDVSPKLRARIKNQKEDLQRQLDSLNELEKLLDENPAIEKFQDILRNVHI